MEKMKRFLIINPFGIGDVLFTTPVISAIKQDCTDAFIGYWCNQRVKDILSNNPKVDVIFPLSRGDIKKLCRNSLLKGILEFLKILLQIKKHKFDACIDFSLDHRYSLIAKILGIKKRIGFNYKKRGRFLTDRLNVEGYDLKHVVEYYLDLLKFLDIPANRGCLELPVSQADRAKGRVILSRCGVDPAGRVIGIAPGAGASWGKDASFKHWQPIKFSALADKLIEEFDVRIVILGSGSERSIADAVLYSMKNKAVNLVGKTNLEELSSVVSNLKLLVANDGGILHLGVAAGVKTVSIFGPVNEKVYGPYPASSMHAVVVKDLPCRPCYKNFRMKVCDRNRECLSSISVEDVLKAARRIW